MGEPAREKGSTSDAPGLVHIVDDDPTVGTSLSNLLVSAGVEAIVHRSAVDFLGHWDPTRVSCILLDIHMPGVSGLDFQARLAEDGISIPVVLMTGSPDVSSSIRGFKAGAVDMLLKPFGGNELLSAVRVGFDRDAGRVAAAIERGVLEDRHDRLTTREAQVLKLVASGLMNKQIAGEFGVSEITVKVHRAAMMRKMMACSIVDLVRMAEILDLDGEAADRVAGASQGMAASAPGASEWSETRAPHPLPNGWVHGARLRADPPAAFRSTGGPSC